MYSGWFKIFRDTVVPRLIPQPKWFNIDHDLKGGDIVYFKKFESDFGESWTVGELDQIVKGNDEERPLSTLMRRRMTLPVDITMLD